MPNFAEKSKKDKIFFRCYVFWFWSFYTFQYKKKEKEISMRRGDEKQVSDLEQPNLLKDAKIVTVGLTPIYLEKIYTKQVLKFMHLHHIIHFIEIVSVHKFNPRVYEFTTILHC